MVNRRLLEGTRPAGKEVHVVLLDGGRAPVEDFLMELVHPDLQDFYACFDKLSESPRWERMGNWFKPLRHASNVWQVSSSNFRILGFRDGKALVLTNGFRKKGKEAAREQVAACEDLQRRFKQSRGER